MKIKTALISTYQKNPAIQLARQLNQSGVEIYASGGTALALEAADIPVISLHKLTGFSNLLDGRVKTLHPNVYAAILARRDSNSDMEELQRLSLKPFDLVVIDLYPFPENVPENEEFPIELIDIGGVALIRAAAKNFNSVAVLCQIDQYDRLMKIVNDTGGASLEFRRQLAKECFIYTSAYDMRIASSFR